MFGRRRVFRGVPAAEGAGNDDGSNRSNVSSPGESTVSPPGNAAVASAGPTDPEGKNGATAQGSPACNASGAASSGLDVAEGTKSDGSDVSTVSSPGAAAVGSAYPTDTEGCGAPTQGPPRGSPAGTAAGAASVVEGPSGVVDGGPGGDMPWFGDDGGTSPMPARNATRLIEDGPGSGEHEEPCRGGEEAARDDVRFSFPSIYPRAGRGWGLGLSLIIFPPQESIPHWLLSSLSPFFVGAVPRRLTYFGE